MKILIAGASGLVGKALVPFLKEKGHQVVKLVRHSVIDSSEIFGIPLMVFFQQRGLRDLMLSLTCRESRLQMAVGQREKNIKF